MAEGAALVSVRLAKQAGAALLWKAIQLAGVKGIFLIRTLLLAKLLSPEDFGLMAIATVVIGVLMSITDFGMVPALVQHMQVDDRHYNGAWTVGILRALMITAVVVIAAPMISGFFTEPRATHMIRLLALRPLLEAAASIKVAQLNRDLRFRSLAFISVSTTVVDTVVAVSLARSLAAWALVAGTLGGTATGTVLSYILAPHRPQLFLSRSAIQPLIRYGRWVFVTGLVAVTGSAMLQAGIARQLGTTELGLYFLAARLAFLPYQIASEVVGVVAFPLYARLQSDIRQIDQVFQLSVKGMATVIFPVYALTITLAPSLVQDFLGPRWTGTAPVIQLLAFASLLGLLTDATIPLLKGLGLPHKVAVLETVQSFTLAFLSWHLADGYGLTGAAASWIPAVAVSQIVSGRFVCRLLRRPFAGLLTPITAVLIVSGLGAAIALEINSVLAGLGGLVMAILLGLGAIWSLLWALDRPLNLGLTNALALAFPKLAAVAGFSLANDRSAWNSARRELHAHPDP
jgi:O-antigen/teichoic acid export membrane protein